MIFKSNEIILSKGENFEIYIWFNSFNVINIGKWVSRYYVQKSEEKKIDWIFVIAIYHRTIHLMQGSINLVHTTIYRIVT